MTKGSSCQLWFVVTPKKGGGGKRKKHMGQELEKVLKKGAYVNRQKFVESVPPSKKA